MPVPLSGLVVMWEGEDFCRDEPGMTIAWELLLFHQVPEVLQPPPAFGADHRGLLSSASALPSEGEILASPHPSSAKRQNVMVRSKAYQRSETPWWAPSTVRDLLLIFQMRRWYHSPRAKAFLANPQITFFFNKKFFSPAYITFFVSCACLCCIPPESSWSL